MTTEELPTRDEARLTSEGFEVRADELIKNLVKNRVFSVRCGQETIWIRYAPNDEIYYTDRRTFELHLADSLDEIQNVQALIFYPDGRVNYMLNGNLHVFSTSPDEDLKAFRMRTRAIFAGKKKPKM